MNIESSVNPSQQKQATSRFDHYGDLHIAPIVSKQYIDKDLEELANANIQSVHKELSSYGYDLDKALDRLFVDLDPNIIKLNAKNASEGSRRINFFAEAFQLVQEAVIESVYVTRERYFWQRRPLLSSALAFSFLSLICAPFFILPSTNNKTELIAGSEPSIKPAEVLAYNSREEGLPLRFTESATAPTQSLKLVNTLAYNSREEGLPLIFTGNIASTQELESNEDIIPSTAGSTLAAQNSVNESSMVSVADNDAAPQVYSQKEEDIVYVMRALTERKKEELRDATYEYLIAGGKIEPTEEMTAFLKELTDYGLSREASLIKASLNKRVTCSDSGFYSHVAEKGDNLFSISDKCGFNFKVFDDVSDVPKINISDVIYFNFDQNKTLKKVTLYKNDDFYILDFIEGELTKNQMLLDPNSIIVEVDLEEFGNIYNGLKENVDLKDKGDLWRKVATRIAKEYPNSILKGTSNGAIKYYVNIKYQHNTIKDHYSVISTSLLPIKHGS